MIEKNIDEKPKGASALKGCAFLLLLWIVLPLIAYLSREKILPKPIETAHYYFWIIIYYGIILFMVITILVGLLWVVMWSCDIMIFPIIKRIKILDEWGEYLQWLGPTCQRHRKQIKKEWQEYQEQQDKKNL